MTIDEIIAGLNEIAGESDEKAKEVADAIRAKSKPVAQVLLNAGAALNKSDAKKEAKRIEQERDEWKEKAESIETEFSQFKQKTPDATAIEAREKAKWEPKVKRLTDQIAEKDATLSRTLQRGGLTKFSRELIKLGADPEYAQEVAAAKYRDRLAPKDEGSLGVLQIGSTLEYDGDDEDEKITALAKDVFKVIPPKFINTNADSGAGVRNGNGGGTTLKTPEQIRQEKQRDSGFSGF